MIRTTCYLASMTSLLVCSLPARGEPVPEIELRLDGGFDVRIPSQHCWLGFSPNGDWLVARWHLSEIKSRIAVWRCGDWKSVSWDVDCASGLWTARLNCAIGSESDRM